MEMFLGKLGLVILIQLISSIKLTSAYYCEWNTCKSTEFCCGDYKCCEHSDLVFDVIIAVCIFVACLFLFCTFIVICLYACRIGRPTLQRIFGKYNNLRRERNSSTTNLAGPCIDVEYDERIYSDPPPPYSEVVQMRKYVNLILEEPQDSETVGTCSIQNCCWLK